MPFYYTTTAHILLSHHTECGANPAIDPPAHAHDAVSVLLSDSAGDIVADWAYADPNSPFDLIELPDGWSQGDFLPVHGDVIKELLDTTLAVLARPARICLKWATSFVSWTKTASTRANGHWTGNTCSSRVVSPRTLLLCSPHWRRRLWKSLWEMNDFQFVGEFQRELHMPTASPRARMSR